MKTAAVIGLALLAACTKTPQEAAIDHNAAMLEKSLEQEADNMEAMADTAANADAARAMENAADNLEDMKGNVADAADAAKDNLQQ